MSDSFPNNSSSVPHFSSCLNLPQRQALVLKSSRTAFSLSEAFGYFQGELMWKVVGGNLVGGYFRTLSESMRILMMKVILERPPSVRGERQ